MPDTKDEDLTAAFRSIILYGQNVASYKFALGRSLLELAATGMETVTLEDLAAPFSRALCEHLTSVGRSPTAASSTLAASTTPDRSTRPS